jgi:uncharacterized 2Fe-2S/4Fe-4S cluster protein (DUF4445 family)
MSSSDLALIQFSPSGKRRRFPPGTSLLQAALELGEDIESSCGGFALCGRCRVEPVAGHFSTEGIQSPGANLEALTPEEAILRQAGQLSPDQRLACRTRVTGDIKVHIPETSRVHQQVIRKAFESRPIELDPLIRLYVMTLEQVNDASADQHLEQVRGLLENTWDLTGLFCSEPLAQSLHRAILDGCGGITIAIRDQRIIVAAWPGSDNHAYGAAVDIGSTTIAAHLCELSTGEAIGSAVIANPQIRFGEDLVSRISYATLHANGAARMTDVLRSTVNELLRGLMQKSAVRPDQVLELTFVGNPVMHHLLLGLDIQPLGQAPFKLATTAATEVFASELGLELAPGARAYAPPCIDGFVGADMAAMLLAEDPWRQPGTNLLIDIGTNAEVALSHAGKVIAASSPTGPAFEGAQIACGQRAAPGAIERVRIDAVTLEPKFKVIGCDAWSDDPGFKAEMSGLRVSGICGSGIIEVIAEMYLAGIIKPNGVIDGGKAKISPRIRADGRTFSYLLYAGPPKIYICQADVRAIQLAKAALYATAWLLMKQMGVESVDRVRLAGAFGSYIDVRYAMLLGLLPDCDPRHVTSAGNAAGTGACIALLNRASRAQIEQRLREVRRHETATDPDFQEAFVAALAIPHARDRFPRLSGAGLTTAR